MRLLFCIIVMFLAGPSWAQSPETEDQIYRMLAYKCNFSVMSHPEMANCLADAVKHMKIRLVAEYRKALDTADGAAANGDSGPNTGAEIAKQERADVVKAQRAWQAYSDAECAKTVDVVSLGGGNGMDIFGSECELRHMAQRIIELQ
jgi:uncharacterized protein YecT (DUF1311 family)